MSVLKVKDVEVNTSHGLSKDGGVIFYAADELPLTIGEAVDKTSGYYFPNDSITFTITLTLMQADDADPNSYSTLDAISVEDTIPAIIDYDVANVTITGSLSTPTKNKVGQKVTIENISLDGTSKVATITIPGTLKASPF